MDIDRNLLDQNITDTKPQSPCGRHRAKNKNIGASVMRLFESFSVVVVQYGKQCNRCKEQFEI